MSKNRRLRLALMIATLLFGALVASAPAIPKLVSANLGPDAAPEDINSVYVPVVNTATEPQSSTPGNQPTLLSAYLIRGPQPDYEIVKYQPRQFAAGHDADPGDKTARIDDPGAYAGWDVMNTPNREINTIMDRNDWIDLTLTRAARLAIAWRGGEPLPAWLSGWTRSSDVVINGFTVPTYVRDVQAGVLQLGSVYDPDAPYRYSRDNYLILFAEADGTPSPAPATPDGYEPPQPNTTCPAWVHDQYVTTGPDGQTYRTWHPQIDPVFWCYFHHEHGSDPSPHKPVFGYTAARMGMEEGHEGFKVYTFNEADGVKIVVTHHFGSARPSKAACVRFHTFDMAVYQAGALLADIHVMADHGKSQHARTDIDLTPPDCPNQAAEADADGSTGVRKFQVASMDPVGYEPWRIDFAKVIIGRLAEFSVNTPSRIADCNTLACDADVPTGDQGEFRFATYGPGFGIQAGERTGEFYTDPLGRTFKNAGDAEAVWQFVAPGANVSVTSIAAADHECYIAHPFGGPYVCQQQDPLETNQNIEGALRSPN